MDEFIKLLDPNLDYTGHEIIGDIIFIRVVSNRVLNGKFWSLPTAHCFIHSNQNNGRIASPNHDSAAILFKFSYPFHANA